MGRCEPQSHESAVWQKPESVNASLRYTNSANQVVDRSDFATVCK
jgi:hypothetical protein